MANVKELFHCPKKAEDGARNQEIRRQVYDAVGFQLLGKRPRKLLDEKDWDYAKA